MRPNDGKRRGIEEKWRLYPSRIGTRFSPPPRQNDPAGQTAWDVPCVSAASLPPPHAQQASFAVTPSSFGVISPYKSHHGVPPEVLSAY
jgi:hypothetical protein